ncbi:MAG: hypothetical protein WBV40_12810 [Candidatus Cybelea sp.]
MEGIAPAVEIIPAEPEGAYCDDPLLHAVRAAMVARATDAKTLWGCFTPAELQIRIEKGSFFPVSKTLQRTVGRLGILT